MDDEAMKRALRRVGDDILAETMILRPYDEHYGPEDAAASKRTLQEIRSLPQTVS